jgi:hypothetical protein
MLGSRPTPSLVRPYDPSFVSEQFLLNRSLVIVEAGDRRPLEAAGEFHPERSRSRRSNEAASTFSLSLP